MQTDHPLLRGFGDIPTTYFWKLVVPGITLLTAYITLMFVGLFVSLVHPIAEPYGIPQQTVAGVGAILLFTPAAVVAWLTCVVLYNESVLLKQKVLGALRRNNVEGR
jgi:hypothetical protein